MRNFSDQEFSCHMNQMYCRMNFLNKGKIIAVFVPTIAFTLPLSDRLLIGCCTNSVLKWFIFVQN
jgi:ribosomal protein S8E